ncbi:hypothetical protein SNE40_022524 [Patella caerulea]|uniref:Succinate-semialdehyde dehydrogenase n=2 Tax=Patella caerulea TaxID=87958 RepID=A0AAN8IZQ2_PATCE
MGLHRISQLSCFCRSVYRTRDVLKIGFMSEKMAASNVRFSSSLMRNNAYINGKWVDSKSGNTFEVYNPSTQQLIGNVPDMTETDVQSAIETAYKTFYTWRDVTAKERSRILRNWYNLCVKHKDDLAKIVTIENGKPLSDAGNEVNYGNDFIAWYSEEARRIYGDIVSSPDPSKRILLMKQPIGVAGMITPWNFPNAMITRKAAAAIAAGCTVVLRPSEDTPFSALALCQLAEEAGIPPGVLNVVTSSRDHAGPIGKVLCESPLVSIISFTGSTAVGKILQNHCASSMKKTSMELGGNAPLIIFDSANVDAAIKGTMGAKFRCGGQTCVCPNRLLVQSGVYDEYVEKLTERVKEEMVIGDGLDKETTLGPLINTRAVDKVKSLVEDAKSKGATITTGGEPSDQGRHFYQATVISDVTNDMRCVQEEIFGPVAPIMKFETEEEAIALANTTTSGLAGYFYSENISQVWRMAEQLEYGIVGVNETLMSTVEAAFGGWKESGLGREGSKYGIEEYLEIKYVCMGGLKKSEGAAKPGAVIDKVLHDDDALKNYIPLDN